MPRSPLHSTSRRRWLHAAFASASLLLASTAFAGIPSATNDSALNTGHRQVIDVLANDSEPDGLALKLTIQSAGTCGATVSVVDNLILHQPVAGNHSGCSLTYKVQADGGGHDTATLTLADTSVIFSDGFESNSLVHWKVIQ